MLRLYEDKLRHFKASYKWDCVPEQLYRSAYCCLATVSQYLKKTYFVLFVTSCILSNLTMVEASIRGVFSLLDTWTVTVFLLVFVGVLMIISYMRAPGNLPPGPRGVPVMGVIPFMGKKPYLQIQAWWRQYGDVYSMYMGSRLVMVVNGIEAMKECFIRQGDNFSGRPWNYFKKLTRNRGGYSYNVS